VSEYLDLTEAAKWLKWLKTLLAELSYSKGNVDQPTELFSEQPWRRTPYFMPKTLIVLYANRALIRSQKKMG
jgi:hypothetical protein